MSYAGASKRAQRARSGAGGAGNVAWYHNYQMDAVELSLSVMVQLLTTEVLTNSVFILPLELVLVSLTS